ncbi:tyrosine-type recombinase/integrase [Halosimplex carlsbadense]|uniref:tyrosine-type recombinase/integrase n=1 Tax=Halosimplex carlsbadense TaxID=171164 RepID=UPI001F261E74|nr:site-specific integrase [Halosimplex carlsbadense]
MTQNLELIAPQKAVDLYLAQREDDASERTVQAHRYRLKHFVRWCGEEDLTNLNDLTGRRLYEYRLWRKDDGDLNPVSLRTQLSTLRAFVRFCESIDAVESGTHEEILLPTLDANDDVKDEMLDGERAEKIREYLERFEYASRKHVLFEIFWATSIRMGTLHSLDLEDFRLEEQALAIRHRPDEGTALKNGERAERIIALPEQTCDVVSDWIAHTRPDVKDDDGREPLVTTEQGRVSQSNIRALVYHITRPCYYGESCCCDEQYPYSYASKCEQSRSPHCLRKGSLTHLLERRAKAGRL